MSTLRQRLQREEGFTLIELLVVIVILGILLAIAVPSYLGFKDRAATAAARSNVREAVPAVEAYYSDHGDYAFNLKPDNSAAATVAVAIQAIDAGAALTGSHNVTIKPEASNASYCVSAEGKTGEFWAKAGPSANIAGPMTAAALAAACP